MSLHEVKDVQPVTSGIVLTVPSWENLAPEACKRANLFLSAGQLDIRARHWRRFFTPLTCRCQETSQSPGTFSVFVPQDERHVAVFLHQPGGEAPPGLEAGR